ncbi:DUF2889 domain-containing protein [Paremcibacter congregatus]|uniref:DUF2889 domain-containing protein n=1 Tax=Paremcibacter congregatus TaxID=2043170 RepID=A0A2G4YM67_9PROT|nr:DUF2889 domain-containing protein [Paremcibacter congregatus]PHZ83398.1 hypothetical protein CRD36_17705 [Paremcibacter congregatus]QDE28132.1 DUF2889 domain-containing protein [Paremcibacter congregatus]|tara:strand:+ start:189 stop:776 length:588 start_codon:yes stop_codon:yes gene_type:complete
MPLSAPAPRKHLHTRNIICDGYEREDGLWDIEARMEDIKTYTFDNRYRGTIEPGEPLHEMYLRLTIDDDMVVQDIEAHIDNHPFATCPAIAPDYRKLVGARIGLGWRRAIRDRMGGVQGCTHLNELLQPLATVAIQTMMPTLLRRKEEAAKAAKAKGETVDKTDEKRPGIIDSCHSWSSEGPVVKDFLPKHYTGK